MLRVIFLLVSFLSFSLVKAQHHNTIIEIDFEDFFEEDTVSFTVNECQVFQNLLLTSDLSVGLTGVQVLFREPNEIVLLQGYGEKQKKETIQCELGNNKKYKMTVVLNGNKNDFTIRKSKGKYIVFEKVRLKIEFIQSPRPFEHE